MFVGSSQARGQPIPLSFNVLNHRGQRLLSETLGINLHLNEDNKSRTEESPLRNSLSASKMLLRAKRKQNSSVQKGKGIVNNYEEKLEKDPFEGLQDFTVEDKMRLVMPTLVVSGGTKSLNSQRKKAPVFGYPLNQALLHPNEQFTQKSSISARSEMSNPISQASLNNFLQEGCLSRESKKGDKFLMKSVFKQTRTHSMRATTYRETEVDEAYSTHAKKIKYSPIKRVSRASLDDRKLRHTLDTEVLKSQEDEEGAMLCNAVLDRARKIAANKIDSSPEPLDNQSLPTEGSLLKFFRDAVSQCKSTKKVRKLKRSETEASSNRNGSPSPSISMENRNTALNTTITPSKVIPRIGNLHLRNSKSQMGPATTRIRPSTSSNLLKTEASLPNDRVIATERGKFEDSAYVSDFALKVKDYLEDKYEGAKAMQMNRNTNRTPNLVRNYSTPGKSMKSNYTFQANSIEKKFNVVRVKTSPRENIKRGLFTEMVSQDEDIKTKSIENLPGKQRSVSSARNSLRAVSSGEILDEKHSVHYTNPGTMSLIHEEEKAQRKGSTKPTRKLTGKSDHKEDFDTTTTGGLLKYAKSMSKGIEEYLIHNAKKDHQSRDVFSEALNIASVIEMRGGTTQKVVKMNRRKSKDFGEERVQIQGVYREIENLEKNIEEDRQFTEEFYQDREKALEKAVTIRPDHLTHKEFEFVKQCYLEGERDDQKLRKMDVMLSRLRFFTLLNPNVRKQFYKHAQYVVYKAGSYIFHEGDVGDLMYVILKGSVNVRAKKVLDNGETHVITLVSLSDGSHFGDLAMIVNNKNKKANQNAQNKNQANKRMSLVMMQEEMNKPAQKKGDSKAASPSKLSAREQLLNLEQKIPNPNILQQKRSASIECAEDCYLLALGRDKYQTFLADIMNKDMNVKVKLLNALPFFKDIDMGTLVPFASNLRKETYKLGQRIFKEGEPVMKFCIVLKGKCKVVKELIEDNRIGPNHCESKLRNFHLKSFEKRSQIEDSTPNEEDKGGLTVLPASVIEKIVERTTTEEDVVGKEKLREKLQTFTFRPLDGVIKPVKRSEAPPNLNTRGFENEQIVDVNSEPPAHLSKPGPLSRNHIFYKEFIVGDIFGFRPIYRRESDARYKEIYENMAQLSVIADSKEVEIYVLPRDCLAYIPEGIKNILIDNIEKIPDFDSVGVYERIQEHKDWRQFKVNLGKEVFAKPISNLHKFEDTYKAT